MEREGDDMVNADGDESSNESSSDDEDSQQQSVIEEEESENVTTHDEHTNRTMQPNQDRDQTQSGDVARRWRTMSSLYQSFVSSYGRLQRRGQEGSLEQEEQTNAKANSLP